MYWEHWGSLPLCYVTPAPLGALVWQLFWGEPACELQHFFSWQLLILKRWMIQGCCGGTVFIPVGFRLCEDTSDERRSSLRLHATFSRVLTSKFVLLLCLIVILPLLSASLTLSLPLSPSISVCPPPLSAVSPLISPVQSAGRHMPSVCGASGDVSCAGVPQSAHNRCGERVERRTFAAATGSCLVSAR